MEFSDTVTTAAGIFGMWSPPAFRGVVDYGTWEAELLEDEDIGRHIRAGEFVPVNIHSDGAFHFLVRIGSRTLPAALTAREREFLVISSADYLFAAVDGAILSGIEHAGARAGPHLHVPLPPGRWQVAVFLIDWTAEPGMQNAHGDPLPGSLPDFTILINPEQVPAVYRTAVDTFDRK
ncbi:hypothetical protein [Actinoplanes sp. L3-i22]|uniref:hypothetical protein n=1 Tax=Actinoplanes sp. L3-i22 TaxID=2836373 RepID=UPI001C771A81|nr:hypothetical protein [Actinoplanes sp. L3-i22]BCY10435.1 hypothetical protein L3i22_055230 [Actinoplanes sp. L3-i22]